MSPDQATVHDFSLRAERTARLRMDAAAFQGQRVTFGGKPIAVSANVGGPGDVDRALEAGADGIGLYRTEFLFLDRSEPPGEDEQLEVYRSALAAFDDPVVVRTFDIGGDKPAPYLNTPREDNPFLGEEGSGSISALMNCFVPRSGPSYGRPARGTVDHDPDGRHRRRSHHHPADHRRGPEHPCQSRGHGAEAKNRQHDRSSFGGVECRAALSANADFFSIGTNDLTQYVLAADRTNGRMARYTDAADPAVLRLCRDTARAGSQAGITTSVCGEAAADPVLAVLFAAMGISRLSVSAPSVDLVKSVVAHASVELADRALGAALEAAGPEEVRALVGDMIGEPR